MWPSLVPSLSGETVSQTKCWHIPNECLVCDAAENSIGDNAHHPAPFCRSPTDYVVGLASTETSNTEKDRQSDSADPRLDKYGRQEGPASTDHPVSQSTRPPCCITVTGWEEDDVTSFGTRGSVHSLSGPEEAPGATGPGQLLSPLKHPKLKYISNKFRQANSFEMEEVQFHVSVRFHCHRFTSHSFSRASSYLHIVTYVSPSGKQCRRRGFWTVGKYTNDLNKTSVQR